MENDFFFARNRVGEPGGHTPTKKSQEYPPGVLINFTVFNTAGADYYCCYCYLFGSGRGQTASMMPPIVFVVPLSTFPLF